MPELVVDFITSLDGYASAEGWPGWWGLEGPEYLAWLGENPEGDYLVLMGATTYRLMYGFTKDGEPGTDVLTGMSKVVFSSTLSDSAGSTARCWHSSTTSRSWSAASTCRTRTSRRRRWWPTASAVRCPTSPRSA